MRFEIDNLGAGSRPDAKRFVIGKHTNGGFVPLLTVNSDCSIKVEQNITCLGDVIEMPIPADPNDPRFAEAMVESWIEGLQKSGATIDETYQGGQPGHTATLAVTINDMTWFNAVNDDYSYTVQVHNNGTLDIGNIQIQESIWWLLSWDEVRPAETVYTIQNLDPNTPSDPITIDRPGIATNGVVAIGVTATGVDPNGQTTTASHVRMMAIVPPPSAIFAVDLGNATAPASIDFDAGESTGLIHNYEWDFGDGTTQTGRTVTHEYTQAGTYNVKLTVTGLGGTHSITRDIEITETPPIA
ncbi:MAG: hypothetical protein CL607_21130 [Anaerolineaceae bacterium]|nr:hypothetical protein [Anaerolineaceae bacterium]